MGSGHRLVLLSHLNESQVVGGDSSSVFAGSAVGDQSACGTGGLLATLAPALKHIARLNLTAR